MKRNHKEGIEDAFNILYNNPFIELNKSMVDYTLNPEEYLIRKETANGYNEEIRISNRAKALLQFSIEEYPKRNITPTELFKLARKEMNWTAEILRRTLKETKAYVRYILK